MGTCKVGPTQDTAGIEKEGYSTYCDHKAASFTCHRPETGPVKNPGPVDALPLVLCRTEPVLKIQAVGLTAANGNSMVV